MSSCDMGKEAHHVREGDSHMFGGTVTSVSEEVLIGSINYKVMQLIARA
jgi:hypothetical protein